MVRPARPSHVLKLVELQEDVEMHTVEDVEEMLQRFRVTRRPGDYPSPGLIITLKRSLESDRLWARFAAIRSS